MGEYDRTGNGQSSKTDWDLRSILCDIAKNWWVILLIACSAAMITYTVMSFDMAPDGIRKRLLEFPAMGKIPVLAHPERYFCVQDTPELLYEFREMGAVLQINKGSVFGRFGEEAERTARFLLENRLAGCVASDAHGADYRTTDMRPVRQFLEERYGEAYAQLLVKVNPRRILEDRQIFYEPSPERKRKRRWFL